MEMRIFLGLANYYRKFVDGFLEIVALITGFTHKNVKFEWKDACEQNFQELKKQFETIPILTIPEGEDGFVVYYEMLGQGLGAVLMRYGRVIAYASCQLKDFERTIRHMT